MKSKLIAGWFALTLAAWWGLAPALVAGAHPNVILVMTDDQGYGEFSCHGNPIARTPCIDRLASQSVRFTDFHVAPMCTPTRGQLMTGLDAFRNGAVNVSSGRTLLRPELKTMADVFHQAGYRTGIFGKWHLGDNYPFRPEDRGFDEAIWFPSSHMGSVPDYWSNDYFDDTYIHNGKRERIEGYCTDMYFDRAMAWIDSQESDQPFFIYLPLNSAHGPLFVPDHYREPVRRALAEHPDMVANLPQGRREALVSFLAMGANIDENMGRLDAWLDKTGRMKDTIVVFLTDNGSTMGESYYNAGMRGTKTTLWEGGHRVPCFVRWPGGPIGDPRDIAELSQVQDLLPTLADLAGIDTSPDHLDGQSLAPLLRQERDRLDERMLVINYSRMPQFEVTYTTGNPAIPVRDGAAVLWQRWRLLENRSLYDVQADPHQDHDVSAQHPDVVQKMRAHLEQWWVPLRETVLEPQRVVIGSEAENPTMLTACEWLDVFVDMQRQVRHGVKENGVWHLVADRPGTYRFELRRWPRESGLALDEGCPETKVVDGVYPAGEALPIAAARLRVGDAQIETTTRPGQKSVGFELELLSGPIELQTWLMDEKGESICGAYYVYVERREATGP